VAKIEIHERMAGGAMKPKEYKFTAGESLRNRADRSEYEPYTISEIDPSNRTVTFSNGVEVKEGQQYGADQKELFRQQIRYTVEQHFRRQKELRKVGVKVLSLFFIDKVENYSAPDGLIKTLFAEAFNELKVKYEGWEKRTPEEVSGAYFATKRKKGGATELLDSSGGESEQDRAAYSLIMKEKERLLSFSEPVCFLFSHSALREGWDNPNVFQICTLNQSTSELKKRQEVGRGLRLAVDQSGVRLHDEKVNALTVVANESYEDFVKSLQKEIEEDFGEDEARKLRVTNQRQKKKVNRKPFDALPKEFEELWNRIRLKTRYAVQIDTNALVKRVVEDLNGLNVEPPRLVVTKARVEAKSNDVFTALQMSGAKTVATLAGNFPLPNLVEKLSELLTQTTPPVRLTRRSLLAIIRGVKNQQMILDNPEEFASQASTVIRQRLEEELVAGIQYEKDGTWYEMTQWDEEIETMSDKMIDAQKSLYERFVYDSDVEKRFAEKLELMGPVKFYVKLPAWFKVPTPVGTYNPDWALVWEDTDQFGDAGEQLYLVRETKGSTTLVDLYLSEQQKIRCGSRHFNSALGVDFKLVARAWRHFSWWVRADPCPGLTEASCPQRVVADRAKLVRYPPRAANPSPLCIIDEIPKVLHKKQKSARLGRMCNFRTAWVISGNVVRRGHTLDMCIPGDIHTPSRRSVRSNRSSIHSLRNRRSHIRPSRIRRILHNRIRRHIRHDYRRKLRGCILLHHLHAHLLRDLHLRRDQWQTHCRRGPGSQDRFQGSELSFSWLLRLCVGRSIRYTFAESVTCAMSSFKSIIDKDLHSAWGPYI
jgi:type III restriction enzyme